MPESQIPYWQKVHQEAIVADLHAHPSLNVSLFKRMLTRRYKANRFFDPFSVRTDFNRLQKGGVDILFSTVYAPEKGIIDECHFLKILAHIMPGTWKKVFERPYFQVAMEMLDEMEEQIINSNNPATNKPAAILLKSKTELENYLEQSGEKPIGMIHNIEGAHVLEGKLENIDAFFQRGVAYLTLAHFYKNEAVNPCFPFPESIQIFGCYRGTRNLALGLEKFGEQVVEKMMDLGMILDIAHCTPPARQQIYDVIKKQHPIIASHVGAFEVNPSPYNLKDCEIKEIADSGGVVAVIFMNYWLMPHETKRGLDFIARTINHIVNVGGIDAVAFGSDFDGFTDPPDDLKDAQELPRLTQRLIAEKYTEEEIKKILGRNVIRVFKDAWKK